MLNCFLEMGYSRPLFNLFSFFSNNILQNLNCRLSGIRTRLIPESSHQQIFNRKFVYLFSTALKMRKIKKKRTGMAQSLQTWTRSWGTSVEADDLDLSLFSAALNPILESKLHSYFLCHFNGWPCSSTSRLSSDGVTDRSMTSHLSGRSMTSHLSGATTSVTSQSMHLRLQMGKLQSGHRCLPSTGARHSTQTTFCCLKYQKKMRSKWIE